MFKFLKFFFVLFLLFNLTSRLKSIDIQDISLTVSIVDNRVVVIPIEYYTAFRNPMKGFREYFGPGYDTKRSEYPYPYGSLIKEYMQWNMLENKESDGVDKIIAYSNHRWQGVEDINMKVIPRVFIVWMEPWHGGYAKNTYTTNPDDLNGWHWPSDIPGETRPTDPTLPITGGYCYPTFQDRVKKLVAKLGQAWDNDPRIAYVEMGIIGEWGEQHDPDITTVYAPHDEPTHVANRTWLPGIEKVLGDAFTAAFKNKKVMVRYAYDFKDYKFGIYWDSWSQPQERTRGYGEMLKLGNRWETQPVGGEITWGWGDLAKFKSFEEVVADPATKSSTIEEIRNLHCNHVGGITWANFNDPNFIPNASLLQKSLGYRYIINEFSYPTKIDYNVPFTISFKVTNSGSSPFYYNWPVEIALLNADTKEKVWGKVLENVNISEWLPGENWDVILNKYTIAPAVNTISKDIVLDTQLPAGKYILSIAVLDPAGMLPSLRFAANNYFTGGRHPMGYVGVTNTIDAYEIRSSQFVDLQTDKSLKYSLNYEDSEITGWVPESNEGTMTVTEDTANPISGQNSILTTILTSTGNHDIISDWWKQKMRWRISLSKGAKYKVSFKAKASAPIAILGKFEQFFYPYSSFTTGTFNLSTQDESFEFTTDALPEVVGAGCFNFYFGHLPPATKVWIDDFSIQEITPLSDENICNGDFENDILNAGYLGSPTIYGWSKINFGATVNFAIDQSTPISGQKSIKITGSTGTPSDNGWKAQLIWQFAPIKDKSYMLEFKAKSSTNFTMTTEAFQQVGSQRNNDLFQQAFTITPTVKSFKLSLPSVPVTLNSDYSLAFWLGYLPYNESLWLDDIKLYQYSDISTNKLEIKEKGDIYTYVSNNKIIIQTPNGGNAFIYSVSGQLITNVKLLPGMNIITSTKGFFIIQIKEGKAIVKCTKIFF
ncbi:MAG: DUF4832 domain-containing protein [Bacteroidales bacterium]